MSNETILVIDEISIPAGGGRGITQTLPPITQATHIERTINGEAIDLAAPQFKKYASTISCRDQRPPSLSGIWPGKIVEVDCIAELNFLTATGSAERIAVSGSDYEEGDFTFYRPHLRMIVKSINPSYDEWNAEVGWSIELEEV